MFRINDMVQIRSYEDTDHAAVSRLYFEGLLLGEIDDNDTGADVDRIRQAYFSRPQDHFWVAEVGGRVVGMIAVVEDEGHVAQIRRLRVERDWQRTSVAEMLLKTAIDHCRQMGFIKLVFDTHFEHDQVIRLLQSCGFQYTRSRTIQNKPVLDFYANLYLRPEPQRTRMRA